MLVGNISRFRPSTRPFELASRRGVEGGLSSEVSRPRSFLCSGFPPLVCHGQAGRPRPAPLETILPSENPQDNTARFFLLFSRRDKRRVADDWLFLFSSVPFPFEGWSVTPLAPFLASKVTIRFFAAGSDPPGPASLFALTVRISFRPFRPDWTSLSPGGCLTPPLAAGMFSLFPP